MSLTAPMICTPSARRATRDVCGAGARALHFLKLEAHRRERRTNKLALKRGDHTFIPRRVSAYDVS